MTSPPQDQQFVRRKISALAPDSQTRDSRRLRRRTAVILLAIPAFLLLTMLFSQQAFNLWFLRPDSSSQTLVFAALSALVFLLFLVLCLMIARILLKLFAERRGG